MTPSIPDSEASSVSAPLQQPPLIVVAGEQLEVDYQLQELPDVDGIVAKTPETPAHGSSAAAVHTKDHDQVCLSLVSSIEILEAENTRLKGC